MTNLTKVIKLLMGKFVGFFFGGGGPVNFIIVSFGMCTGLYRSKLVSIENSFVDRIQRNS